MPIARRLITNCAGAGYLGLCPTPGKPLQAREHCGRTPKYDPNDPITYFELCNVFRDLFNNTGRCDYLASAPQNSTQVAKLNGDLLEAEQARD